MATAGKRGKGKGKVMSLAEFQGTGGVPEGFKKNIGANWADLMESGNDVNIPLIKEVVLPTAPKADRATEIDTSRVPKVPPYKLYMGNIPYDCEEDMIRDFFLPLEPVGVDLPKGDKGSKGFCYVEFADRETLISALGRDGANFGTRAARISLPEDRRDRDADRPGRRDGGMGGGFDPRDPGRTDNDWRREPRALPPVKADDFGRDSTSGRGFDRSAGSGFDRSAGSGFDRSAGSGFDRSAGSGFDRSAGSGFRNGGFQPFQDRSQRVDAGPERDFENVRRQDPNFGPGTGRDSFRDSGRDSFRESGRDSGSSWERNQGPRFVPAHDRSSYNNNDRYQDRYQADNRRQLDSQGHGREEQPYDSVRESVRPSREQEECEREEEIFGQDPNSGREVPGERKKLQLKPRSKPKEEIAAPAEVTRSSIFGDARPVDTTKKELEIEEKLKTVLGPDSEGREEGSRIRRTSTGSGKSGQRSRQTSESGSHHSPREAGPPSGPRSGQTRQDSDRSQGDQRRPARILTNPDRENRRHENYAGHRDDRRDTYDRKEERRDNYDRRGDDRRDTYDRKEERRDNYDRRPARGGAYGPQYNRRDHDSSRYDNNGRGHYDGPSRQHRDNRNQYDDHHNNRNSERNSERNSDRRDRPRTERSDRPRNDVRNEKEPEYTMVNKFNALNVEDDVSFDANE